MLPPFESYTRGGVCARSPLSKSKNFFSKKFLVCEILRFQTVFIKNFEPVFSKKVLFLKFWILKLLFSKDFSFQNFLAMRTEFFFPKKSFAKISCSNNIFKYIFLRKFLVWKISRISKHFSKKKISQNLD